jgi:uncharacterized membrane protein YjfL (UPF0719 family)
MLSAVLSVLTYFVSSRLIRRYLDEAEIPGGMTRSVLVFVLSLAVACVVGAAASRLGR